MEPFIIQLIVPILSGLVLAIIIYGFKLPDLMKENTTAIRQLTLKVDTLFQDLQAVHAGNEINTKRHEVVQRVVSDILQYPIDTKVIAEDYAKYPPSNLFKKKNFRES